MSNSDDKAVSSRTIKRRDFLLHAFSATLILDASVKPATETSPNQGRVDAADSYANYIRTSKDFRRVKQDKAWCARAYPGWFYMPWTYQWNIGYTQQSGEWSRAHGYNGAFLDGNAGSPDSPAGKLAWIDKFGLK